MNAGVLAHWRDAFAVTFLLLSACGSSSEIDAALLNIDDAVLQQDIEAQLTDNASHQNNAPRRDQHLPILLVHGMAGFSFGRYDYFYHVPKILRSRGFDVVVAHTDPFQSTAYRAKQLAIEVDAALKATGAPRLNIVAHSQGGLDARYLISSMGYGVASQRSSP